MCLLGKHNVGVLCAAAFLPAHCFAVLSPHTQGSFMLRHAALTCMRWLKAIRPDLSCLVLVHCTNQ